MSTPMDHIAYLSQEIGPRPAGTEEANSSKLRSILLSACKKMPIYLRKSNISPATPMRL